MKYAVIAGALALASTPTFATEQLTPLSYDYVELGYTVTSIDEVDDLSFAGYMATFSKQFAESWYVKGLYSQVSDDISDTDTFNGGRVYYGNEYVGDSQYTYFDKLDVELTRYEIGVGYIHAISDVTSIDFSAQYGQFKFTTETTVFEEDIYEDNVFYSNESRYSDSETADILSLNAQVRHLLSDSFEVNAGIGYERLHDEQSDNSVVLKAGANYFFTPSFSVAGFYRQLSDYNDIALTARYNF